MNSASTVELTIKSLINQNYKKIEYIIIDGLSKDGTLDIIKKYKEYIDLIISEKDKGIYDALNKGIRNASGDIIGFLHSDDRLNSDDTISKIVENFKKTSSDMVIGNIIMVNQDNQKIVRRYNGSPKPEYLFSCGIMPPHPAVYIKKNIYEKYGFFNLRYKIAADYEFLFKLIVVFKVKFRYFNQVYTQMNIGGLSTKNYFNQFLLNYEIFKIHRRYSYKLNFIKKLIIRKKEYKIDQKYKS
jgi:glycosyltransferase involved in cell wall biosynthesis